MVRVAREWPVAARAVQGRRQEPAEAWWARRAARGGSGSQAGRVHRSPGPRPAPGACWIPRRTHPDPRPATPLPCGWLQVLV